MTVAIAMFIFWLLYISPAIVALTVNKIGRIIGLEGEWFRFVSAIIGMFAVAAFVEWRFRRDKE